MEVEVTIGVHGVISLPLGIERERTDMSEQVYILERRPRHHKPIGFGASQAASC